MPPAVVAALTQQARGVEVSSSRLGWGEILFLGAALATAAAILGFAALPTLSDMMGGSGGGGGGILGGLGGIL